jgi:hypothetical protein
MSEIDEFNMFQNTVPPCIKLDKAQLKAVAKFAKSLPQPDDMCGTSNLKFGAVNSYMGECIWVEACGKRLDISYDDDGKLSKKVSDIE